MAETLIKNFTQISKTDTEIAGGKGASLGEMTQTGIPVPDGFVILSNAFDKFSEETDLNVEIDAVLNTVDIKEVHTVENASEKIQAMILSREMPEDIKTEILKFYKNIECKFVAVRSSATSEDSASAAWAGQLDSFLNTTEKTLLENVKKCWASLFTPRAIFYRFANKLNKDKISVAVVVQKMVNSEESGIAFSVHPVTQDENQIIIEAGFGLGEAIVSGSITPDSYVVDKQGFNILDININEQTKALYKKAKGGNEWKKLGEKGKKQVLTTKEVIELSKLIAKIENHYGFPCDVEWAQEKGKFYIVQSRPITTLKKRKTNKHIHGNYKDYQRLFQWKGGGLPYLISDIFMDHYKTLNGLVILSNGVWTNFLPKNIIKETLKDGLNRISNPKEFEDYRKNFEDYRIECSKVFERIIKKQDVTKGELKKTLGFFIRLFYYYSKTEFFYVDKAYEYSKRDSTTRQNLEKFDKIKNGGREYLNKVFLGNESYIEELLNILEKKFSIGSNKLKLHGKEELIRLFENKRVSDEVLKDRKLAYVMQTLNSHIEYIEGEEAKKAVDGFLDEAERLDSAEIKGISANEGKTNGKVNVMNYGYEDFHKIPEFINEMQDGDILVADTTAPEIMLACKKASAILTNQGGLMSHAAIVSRELNIPCIVGLNNITDLVKTGDLVEVDANKGIVRVLKKNR